MEPEPSTSYRARRQAYLDLHLRQAGGGIHAELARLACGAAPDPAQVRVALDKLDAREDCADFRLAGILRLLYQYGDSPLLPSALLAEIERSVLGFKYWPDEPGVDDMCTWSENHQILFASGGYLAGQICPDRVFTNAGYTGREQMARMEPRIRRWLDLRFRTGFSEWLSNVYYVEDLAALLNLVDFCAQPEIARRAAMVVDTMLLDLALNHYRGTLGCTHGRSYFQHKVDGQRESTAPVCWLLYGQNAPRAGSMAAVALALSPCYQPPAVLCEIAGDTERAAMDNRQRMGIRVDQAARWGLDPNRLEDGMAFLSLEAYSHPRTIDLMARLLDAYNWWENDFFAPFKRHRRLLRALHKLGLLPILARLLERDLCRNTREEVNLYTYRTPHYLLSSALDYRPGYGGDQQQIWQATLGPRAVCFTTDPPNRRAESPTPNYWTGSGSLPRVAQVKNVVIAVYRIDTRPGLYVTNRLPYTHAWLPRDEYDEVVERDGWILARAGEGYLALRSQHPYRWCEEGEWAGREVIVPGKRNIWLCELGSAAESGSFQEFCAAICAAPIVFRGQRVDYTSPSQGRLQFGWHGPLRQEDTPVLLGEFPRYDNPYVQAALPGAGFPADQIEVRLDEDWLRLDWGRSTRETSG